MTEDRFTVHRDEPEQHQHPCCPEPVELDELEQRLGPLNGWEWLNAHTGELVVMVVVLTAIIASAVAR